MKIGIIVGSHRKKSQSTKVGEYIQAELKKLGASSTYLFDLRNNPLPLWDEGIWSSDSKWDKIWKPISKELKKCDGFVVISPEWGGMAPSGLKNFFLLCSKRELAHKPGMLVGVSASRGGSYPIAELRMSSYKNSHINYIPEHVILQKVEDLLNESNKKGAVENKADSYIKGRITYSLKYLLEYTKAMGPIRDSRVYEENEFPYGM